MKIDSRSVHFFELNVHTLPMDNEIPVAPQISMELLLSKLLPTIKQGVEIKCGKTPIEVTRISFDGSKNEIVLLLNKPDPERSDVAYRKRTTKTRRLGNKAADEDVEVSSHVLIKMTPNLTTAKMLLTTGASIPPAKIVSLFNTSYKAAKFLPSIQKMRVLPLVTNLLNEDSSARTYEVNHRFSFNAMPNGLLVDIIKSGKIVGLNLIDLGNQAFDSTVRCNVDRMAMHIDLRSATVDIPLIQRIVKVAKGKRKFDASKIRVEYLDNGTSSGEVRDKTFDASQLEKAFTRSETIALDNPHYDHQTEISQDIVSKMRDLI
ncbi:hypothetical protein [Hydrogenophaga sp. ZJX-1]|uniref:hypothetical protein n=1 Tax=Hydrogenophaga sp. ZJX-1 TaxID=3404778 RepID=UPI003B285CFC